MAPIYEDPDTHVYDYVKSPAFKMSDDGPSGVELELAQNPAYGAANVSTTRQPGPTDTNSLS